LIRRVGLDVLEVIDHGRSRPVASERSPSLAERVIHNSPVTTARSSSSRGSLRIERRDVALRARASPGRRKVARRFTPKRVSRWYTCSNVHCSGCHRETSTPILIEYRDRNARWARLDPLLCALSTTHVREGSGGKAREVNPHRGGRLRRLWVPVYRATGYHLAAQRQVIIHCGPPALLPFVHVSDSSALDGRPSYGRRTGGSTEACPSCTM
jgi:hypothetical protein